MLTMSCGTRYKKSFKINIKGHQDSKSHRSEGGNWDLVDEMENNRINLRLIEGFNLLRGN
jgi:hypothetical protein